LVVHDRPQLAIVRIIVAAVIISNLAIILTAHAAGDETLLLEVIINGNSTGKIGQFVLRNGALFARRSELNDVGLRVPASAQATRDGLIALSSLAGVTAELNQTTQTLAITASNDRLLPVLLGVGPPSTNIGQIESGTGITLNYDLTDSLVTSQNIASGEFDLRAFSPWGVAETDALAYAGATPSGPGGYTAIRLDSSYAYSDPDTERRYRLGDFVTGTLSWTRPVRLGGAQVTSDFSMRPDLVTFPLPSVGGTTAVPSTVDVLVNGTQLLSRGVQPGPFQIPALPVVTGAGTVTMTVSDALGRQVTTTLPFYASSNLLASGLQTYSAEVGAVRLNWGLISNDYGNLAEAATYRRGLSDSATIEAHTEGTAGQFMAGGGLVLNAFNLGVVNLDAAASTGAARPGTQFAVGAQRTGQVLSLGASAIIASRNYRDIAAMNGDPVPRRLISANAGLSLGRFGSFGLAYIAIDRDAVATPVSFFAPGAITQNSTVPGGVVSTSGNLITFQPAERSHILSASYSLQFGDLSIYATGYRDFAAGGGGVLFGLTIPLGSRSSANMSVGTASSGRYGQIQAVQSPVSIGDWGYQVYGAVGQPDHAFAQLQYKSPWSLLSAGADRTGPQTTIRAEAQGALSYVDGGVFPSNTINDSFGIADTGSAEGIRVYDENREVGQTNSAGKLLLPDLRSFEVNHISIDPADVPPDAAVPFISRDVRPQDRSGVVISFPVQASRGALLRLVDDAGKPIEVGSSATLAATGTTVPVGYNGEAFIQDLAPSGNRLTVQRPDGHRCMVVFAYHAKLGDIPTIGPLRCQEPVP
jgi:outer membrane usher protein